MLNKVHQSPYLWNTYYQARQQSKTYLNSQEKLELQVISKNNFFSPKNQALELSTEFKQLMRNRAVIEIFFFLISSNWDI